MYCMEHDVDVSHGFCFPRHLSQWEDTPFITRRPILFMSLGYGEKYRWQAMKDDGTLHLDIKPEIDKVVEWID